MSDELVTIPKKRLEDLEAQVAELRAAAEAARDVDAEDPFAAAFARARAGFRARDRQREGT